MNASVARSRYTIEAGARPATIAQNTQ
jgi:hypothetical protein